jgi:hypothetical protein
MKIMRKELRFNIPTRRAFVNITPQVEACLRESGIREGLALTNAIASKLNRPCPFLVAGRYAAGTAASRTRKITGTSPTQRPRLDILGLFLCRRM